jgi:hypothetical protein
MVMRTPQLRAAFEPGNPLAGYYNDLTPELHGEDVATVRARLGALTASPRVNHTTVAQLGLAAWQLGRDEPAWLDVTLEAATWLAARLDAEGRLLFDFAMPHTYELPAPWSSAMTQGEAVSLFVRAAAVGGQAQFLDAAVRAAGPLFEPPLLVPTADGPVLQEYPTAPPAHVLNGWIFALFGLYDLAATSGDERASNGFREGASTVAARVHLYDSGGWSRYDLYPHPLVHLASPWYHRLHIELLDVLNELAPDPRLVAVAARWEKSAASRAALAFAVARKVAFRLVRPRRLRQTVKR